jgi:hypothetical protein
MLDVALIRRSFDALNEELKARGVVGEIGLCGGAVMCLVFDARRATKDVDAIFAPARELREAAARVAEPLGVPENWLNDAAKGYFAGSPPQQEVLNLSNLRVWSPTADYMLAMKCVAARFDTHDRDDVLFLIKHLGLRSPSEVFAVVSRYYPHQLVPPKTQFLVEELLDQSKRK